jgi:hypothetical protein
VVEEEQAVRVFFDVDFTLIGVDQSLRPGVKDTFRRLVEDGHKVFLWSGQRNPWHAINDHNLDAWVTNCYRKPIEDHHNHIEALSIPMPDFCIDDNKDIIDIFGGYVVPPYIYTDMPDNHMERIYLAVKEFAEQRTQHPEAKAPGIIYATAEEARQHDRLAK